MLTVNIFSSLNKATRAGLQALLPALQQLHQHPAIVAEIRQLLPQLAARHDHRFQPLDRHPDIPLIVHAEYKRVEILAAVGEGNAAEIPAWREGVRYQHDAAIDLLAFTLDKTDKQFSPTTRYNDYALSRELIHWESQSGTRAGSPTGQRYQQHVAMGSDVWLFARQHKRDDFRFLGPARYLSHQGEKPMAITWQLRYPLPGDLYEYYALAIA